MTLINNKINNSIAIIAGGHNNQNINSIGMIYLEYSNAFLISN